MQYTWLQCLLVIININFCDNLTKSIDVLLPVRNRTTTIEAPYYSHMHCKKFIFKQDSVCKNHIKGFIYHHRYISYLIKVETYIQDIFNKIQNTIDYIQYSDNKLESLQGVFRLFGMMKRKRNMHMPPKDILQQIITAVMRPSFKVCLESTKEFFCKRYFPLCKQHGYYQSFYFAEQPCKEMCNYIVNSKCKHEKVLYDLLMKYGVIHSSLFNCDWLRSYYRKWDQCFLSSDATNFLETADKNEIYAVLNTVKTTPQSFSNHTTPQEETGSTNSPPRIIPTNNNIIAASTMDKKALDKLCPRYSTLLPKGECISLMKDSRISQSIEAAIRQDDALKIFYSDFVSFMTYIIPRGVALENLGECGKRKDVRKLLKTTKFPTVQEFHHCLNVSKDFACQTYHPICLHSNVSGDIKVKISPPCRRGCESFQSCKKTMNLVRFMDDFVTLCPKYHVSDRFLVFPSCRQYIHHNQSEIERCQMHHPQSRTENKATFTTHCYEGVGISYNGTLNITVSGRTCKLWNLNPYLTEEVYPDLTENHCRNPQGYGTKPWCYVHMNPREWEYCDILECVGDVVRRDKVASSEDHDVETNFVLLLSVIMVLVIVCGGGLIALLVHCLRKNVKDEEEVNDEAIDPYSELAITPDEIRIGVPTFNSTSNAALPSVNITTSGRQVFSISRSNWYKL